MLRLQGGQVESLWDELLPEGLRELPEDLAQMDGLLRDEALLAPIEAHWDREAVARGRSAKGHGRPSIPMQTYVRLMVLKHRFGWGYQTLLREVSDSLHLRRFCLIPLHEEVPDESTVRKLTRRLGPQTVAELSRLVIAKAQRETRFRARAVRIDSTVVEADVRYPTDAGLVDAAAKRPPAHAAAHRGDVEVLDDHGAVAARQSRGEGMHLLGAEVGRTPVQGRQLGSRLAAASGSDGPAR